jgi:acetyltransferase
VTHVDHFLNGFFWPKSIAVVGATPNPLKINFRLTQNLVEIGFPGKIFPVNPRAKEILGLKAYPRLTDIPDAIDLVVSAVPAPRTLAVAQECSALGIKKLVIVSGGFSEGGAAGRDLHQVVAAYAREQDIRVLGPNTLSPVNSAAGFAISYNRVRSIKRGGMSFAFQSGFYDPRIRWICSGLGVNKILDMGNKLDINEVDALEYFTLDPETKGLAIHVESVRGNGEAFARALKRIAEKKPTIVLKSGRTPAGAKAAASHTGAIAQENDLVFDSIVRQTGAIRAQNLEEFFDLAKAFAFLNAPQGNRLAVIVMSGGEGVMATDACVTNGLEPAQLSSGTHKILKKVMPAWEIPVNPFDGGVCLEALISRPLDFFNTLTAIPRDEGVDCIIMQMPPGMADFTLSAPYISPDLAEKALDQFTQGFVGLGSPRKPFAMWRSTMDAQEEQWVQTIESRGVPVFLSSARAIAALAAMYRDRTRRSAGEGALENV